MTSRLPLPCPSKSTCKLILCTLIASMALLIAILRSAPTSIPRQEPVGSQPGRPRFSTLYVFSSSIVTIIACSRSIQYPNIPKSWDSVRRIRWRKIFWFAFTIFVPEMALAHEIVDRAVAVASLQELRDAKIETEDQDMKWTLTHSYYANMDGLRFPLGNNLTVNTRQFIYLYSKKLILSASPQISEQEIKSKSRSNYLVKGVATIGTLWLIQSLVRQTRGGLPISQLQISTLAFAACAISTIWFARHKPQNISTHTVFEYARTFPREEAIIFNDMQTRSLSYGLTGSLSTPDKPWYASQLANGGIEFPKGDLRSTSLFLTALVILSGIIYLSAWNFTFPTPVERTAWRIASLTMTILPIFTTLALLITRPSSATREDIEQLEHNIVSVRAEYIQAYKDLDPPDAVFRGAPTLQKEVDAYMSKKHEGSPHDRERAADFEWHTSLSRGPRAEARRGRELDFPVPWTVQLIMSVWERRAGRLSRLDKLKLQLDLLDWGVRVLFMMAKIYGVSRGLILVLSFASLRRISDVYTSTAVGG